MPMVLIKLVMLVPAAKLISTARNETKPTPPCHTPEVYVPLSFRTLWGVFYVPSELMRKYEGVKAQK